MGVWAAAPPTTVVAKSAGTKKAKGRLDLCVMSHVELDRAPVVVLGRSWAD